jgi:hypothetical protein
LWLPLFFFHTENQVAQFELQERGCDYSRFGAAAEEPAEYVCSHPERSEGSAFLQIPGKKQIPRANLALEMTVLEFYRSH